MRIWIFFLVLPWYTATASDPEYTFLKKEKGISLYYRWVLLPEKLKVREMRAEFEIRSAPGKIIAVLKDDKAAAIWMKGASKVNTLGSNAGNSWHTYILYDIPWPLSNQDCIIRYDIRKKTGETLISIKGIPEYIPAKDGVTRIENIEGYWSIKPVNSNLCKVVYTVYSGQPPRYPRWITDPIIQGNLINTMEAFRQVVEQ